MKGRNFCEEIKEVLKRGVEQAEHGEVGEVEHQNREEEGQEGVP